jgi:hypothetical protein
MPSRSPHRVSADQAWWWCWRRVIAERYADGVGVDTPLLGFP